MDANKQLIISTYYDGIVEGISMYAHWKDGVQYVGTTGKTLKKALETVESERQAALNANERKHD